MTPPAGSLAVPTTVESVSAFLRTCGLQQPDVADAVKQTTGISLISGVIRTDSHPLGGVDVRILGDGPSFLHGHTSTRNDGRFDLRVLGGRSLTVVFSLEGYIPVHRKVDVPSDGYVNVDNVIMIPRSTRSTSVPLGVTTWAMGDEITDADGTRTAQLLFPAGLKASVVGGGALTGSVNVRLTEFTVGSNGPKRMPALLPPTSAYTYAIDLSFEGLEEKTIKFDKDVYFYVNNFFKAGINPTAKPRLPVGTVIPSGYYDREKGAWTASANGRVIAITGKDFSGRAIVDNGIANYSPNTGSPDYISTDELKELGKFPIGTQLWRIPLSHFSAWDFNFPYGPCEGCKAPGQAHLIWPFFAAVA